jgi:hypothetical protein
MTLVRTSSQSIRAALVAVLALGAAACGDNIKVEQPAAVDASRSTVAVEPDTARADGVEYVIVRVTVVDGGGAPLAARAVTLAASGDGNLIEQPPMLTGSDGVAIGSIASTIAGVKEIEVNAGGVVLSQRLTATFTAVASQLAFVTQPGDGVAGELLDPVVQVAIQDNLGTTMADVTGPVHLAVLDPLGDGELQGKVTVDAVDGIATFANLRVLRAGAGYTLVATAPGVADAVSDAFTIVPAAPATLAFAEQPTDVVAGEAIAPAVVVAARDLFGNLATNATATITVGLDTNPGNAVLGGTLVRYLADGIATFHDLTVDRAGQGYTLFAGSAELVPVISEPFAVGAAAVASLQVLGLADPFTAGHTGILLVSARDQLGNLITDFDHTVAFTSSDGQALLPASYAFQADDHGRHAFTGVALRTAGVQTVTVTSTTDSSITGGRTVLVMPAGATHLQFTTQPTNGRSGVSLAPAVGVTLRDPYGNVASESQEEITLSIAAGPDGAALVGGGPRPPVTGVAAFDHVQLDKAGTYTLKATAPGITAATSASFTIAAGDPAAVGFVVQPSDVVAGQNVAPAVQVGIFDAAGNPATTATNSVTLAVLSGPTGATLVGLGPTAAVGGVAAFNAVHGATAGTYTVQATSGTLAAATSTSFDIGPAAAGQLAFVTQPANAVAGVALSPAVSVAVQDQYGNLLPTATTPVSLEIVTSPAGGVLLGGGPITAVAGIATFPALDFQRAGTYTIRATAAGGLVSAPSASFTIAPAEPYGLGFVTQPGNVLPDTTITPAIQVALQDRFGNTIDASAPAIGLQLMGGNPSAVLTGGAAVAPVNGIATFAGLSVNLTAGGYKLVAVVSGLTTGYSDEFAVFGAPDRVGFTLQPVNSPAGTAFTVAAAVKDASGSTITTDESSQITVAIGTNPAGGALAGTTTRTVVHGVATFSGLAIDNPGTGYTLTATSASLTAGLSNAFTVFGPADKLAFTVEPPAAVALDAAFSVQVTVEDAGGRRVETATPDITVAKGAGPAGAVLGGTLTRAAVAGQVTFGGLSLDVSAPAYTLVASGGSLTSATSTAVDVYTTPALGDLMITEIMSNTGGNRLRQWFEIKNLTTKVIAIDGLKIEEAVTDPTPIDVDSTALLHPKGYFVFGASNTPADNGGVTTIDYVYPSGFNLGDATGGDLLISLGTTPIAEVAWNVTTWPHTADHAMNLSSKAQASDASSYYWWWCDAVAALPGTGWGTPGADNDSCGVAPVPPVDSCKLASTADLGFVHPGFVANLLGQFSEATITDRFCGNDLYPYTWGQLGFGPHGSDPATWTWSDADFDPAWAPGTCPSSIDQQKGAVTFATAGSYDFGYRVALVDPDTGTGDFAYCDRNAIADPPTSGSYGTVRVAPECSDGSQVVISQVYGGGGNGGATYQNDFIELHNRGLTPVTLTNWSVQYASATGTGDFGGSTSLRVSITATIPAGGYFLVKGASAAAIGAPLPGADATNTNLDLAGANGKVALVKQTASLGCNGGSNVCNAAQLALIADLVGYGTANFFEGAAAAGALSNTTAAHREDAGGGFAVGCVDTHDNFADFTVATPSPRWSGSATTDCGCFGP